MLIIVFNHDFDNHDNRTRNTHREITAIIIQHIVTLPKYGHGELNICRPHITDILRYT